MGTCNFAHPKNASKYFVVGMNREEQFSECDCGRHYEWEDGYKELDEIICTTCGDEVKGGTASRPIESWEWDDLKQCIMDALDELSEFISGESSDYSRNYGSTFLGEASKSKSWGDAEFTVSLKPCITSAYYEGATLDFAIEITTYGETYDYNEESLDSILDDGFDEYYVDLNRGLAAIFRPFAEQWIEDTIKDLSDKVEKVFQTFSEHKLQRQGVMSNGVGVYAEVE